MTQGAQTRTFVYDSLKRLTSATNPESGATSYVYDPNGNLCEKTDARTTKTTIVYDALNRPTQKTYSGTTTEGINAANATPSVYYKYDNQTLPAGAPVNFNRGFATGRLVAVTYGNGAAGSYYGYDELGRVLRRTQKFEGNTTDYTVTAAYNRAGAMTSETYPSGNTVTFGYDMASRLTSFSGNLSGTQTTYATVTQFNAASQIERETYGMTTPLYLKQAYNNRLQLVDTRLGTINDATSWDRGRLSLIYGTTTFNLSNTRDAALAELTVADLQGNNTDNNGNIKRMYSFLPNGTIPQRDDYAYDPLNRISSMTESQRQTPGGAMVTNVASQNYGYDRYGNNTITGMSPSGLTFNAANNRINMAGYGYDSAGNLTTQNNQARSYDAENRMTSAASTGFYTYDGEGKRVKRTASGTTYCYVYGIDGELLAEYMGTSSPTLVKQYGYKGGKLLVTAEGATLKWLVTDHLGSTRMELNSAGSIDKRHDYLPFGEELLAGTVRSAANAYEPPLSNTRQRFGTYERDNETGLDFAQARYYSSVQGRFTSPDSVSGAIGNPQTLNLYSYVMGNPLRYSDPTGHYASDKTSPEEREQERMRRRELDLARLKCGVCNLEYKGWRIVPGTNPGGKPIINFRWVNDPKVHDVPNDHRYVDTEGRVIQLYGDDKTNNHGWGVHKAGPDPVVSDQTSDPPSQFRKYGDLRAALIKNGYQGFYDPHPDHIGGYNFSQPLSPTFNITIFTKEGRGFAGYNDTIDHMDAHVELYSPINNRVKHITKETVPNAWGRFKKWVWQ